MSEIAKAFIKAQSEMRTPKKGNSNPFFKSKYADLNSVLEAVLEALHNNGIAILQPTVFIEGKSFVNTVLLHESGERLEGFTEILFSKPNDAQAQGSGITYARRYGLQSICGVGAEDDDGNKAIQQPKKETPILTSENFNKALGADEKGISATLKAITEKRLIATTEQILELENQLSILNQ